MKTLLSISLLLAIFFLSNLQQNSAQTRTIKGTVHNSNTNGAIPDLDVQVKGEKEIVKTSSTGEFSILVSDSIRTIHFENFIGYKIKEIKWITANKMDIYLQEISLFDLSMDDLLKIKVTTAGKKEQQVADIPASVVVIKREDIEKMGYLYLKDIIRNIPGYYAMNNLGIDIFGVRGFVKDKGLNFKVLMNGINVTDDLILGFYDIPVQAIEKIEIIRGPMSVIYGDNAFFGVINIFTNTGKQKKYGHKASFMAGSNALINSFIYVADQKQSLKYTINCSYQKSDGSDFDITKMIKNPDRLNYPFYEGPNQDGLGVPSYARTTNDKLNWSEKYFSISLTDEHFYANVIYAEAFRKRYYYYPSLANGSESTIYKGSFSIGYKDSLSRTLISDSRIVYDGLYRRNLYDLITPNFNGLEIFRTSKLQVQTDLFWKPCKNIDISTGIDYNTILEDLDEGDVPQGGAPNFRYFNVHPEDESRKLAFYTQAELNFLSKFTFVAGIRIEKQFGYRILFLENLALNNDTTYEGKRDNSSADIYPRLALLYHLNTNHVFKFMYGKAGKQPSTEVIGDDFLDVSDGFKTNEYSKPEYITTYEINYNGKYFDNLFVNISLFRNELNKLLIEKSFRYDPGIVRVLWTNRGKMNTNGFELTLTGKFETGTQLEISGVYQKTNDIELNTEASYSPDWLGYFKLYQPIYKGISFSLIGNYVDAMKPHFNTASILDTDGNPTSDYIGRTSDEVNAYYTFDFQLRAEMPFNKFAGFLALNIQNVLNKEVRYPTFSINNAWADKGTLGYERLINFSVGFKF